MLGKHLVQKYCSFNHPPTCTSIFRNYTSNKCFNSQHMNSGHFPYISSHHLVSLCLNQQIVILSKPAVNFVSFFNYPKIKLIRNSRKISSTFTTIHHQKPPVPQESNQEMVDRDVFDGVPDILETLNLELYISRP